MPALNENDLLYLIAKRARGLGDMTMSSLRSTNGYDCSSDWEAQQKSKGMSRGELIETILSEEFHKEFPRDFSES